MNRWRYAVTLEFETKPPTTHRGEVETIGVHTAAKLAVQRAKRALRPTRWTSVVCLLERGEDA